MLTAMYSTVQTVHNPSDVLHVRTEYLAIDPAYEHIKIAFSSGIMETRFHMLERLSVQLK